jgi:hypothetical protein
MLEFLVVVNTIETVLFVAFFSWFMAREWYRRAALKGNGKRE